MLVIDTHSTLALPIMVKFLCTLSNWTGSKLLETTVRRLHIITSSFLFQKQTRYILFHKQRIAKKKNAVFQTHTDMVIDYVCLVITPKGCTNKILSKKKQKNLLKLWKGIWNNISANWLCSWKKNPKWTEKLHQSAESFFLCLGWGVRTARLKWYSSVLNFFFFLCKGSLLPSKGYGTYVDECSSPASYPLYL